MRKERFPNYKNIKPDSNTVEQSLHYDTRDITFQWCDFASNCCMVYCEYMKESLNQQL